MRKTLALLGLTVVWNMTGCASDSTEKIAALQEQLANVTQQLDDTKKQVDGLQEANQRAVQAIDNLTQTVERLNATMLAAAPTGKGATKVFVEQEDLPPSQRGQTSAALPSVAAFATSPSPSAKPGATPLQEQIQPFLDKQNPTLASHQKTASASISCGQVWKQLGQGKSADAVARALGASVQAVQQCEQKVGR
jgi:hypothetical protein